MSMVVWSRTTTWKLFWIVSKAMIEMWIKWKSLKVLSLVVENGFFHFEGRPQGWALLSNLLILVLISLYVCKMRTTKSGFVKMRGILGVLSSLQIWLLADLSNNT